jgi:hypothetical protein
MSGTFHIDRIPVMRPDPEDSFGSPHYLTGSVQEAVHDLLVRGVRHCEFPEGVLGAWALSYLVGYAHFQSAYNYVPLGGQVGTPDHPLGVLIAAGETARKIGADPLADGIAAAVERMSAFDHDRLRLMDVQSGYEYPENYDPSMWLEDMPEARALMEEIGKLEKIAVADDCTGRIDAKFPDWDTSMGAKRITRALATHMAEDLDINWVHGLEDWIKAVHPIVDALPDYPARMETKIVRSMILPQVADLMVKSGQRFVIQMASNWRAPEDHGIDLTAIETTTASPLILMEFRDRFVLFDPVKGHDIAVLHDTEYRDSQPGGAAALPRTVNKHLKDSSEFKTFRLDLKELKLVKRRPWYDVFRKFTTVQLGRASS